MKVLARIWLSVLFPALSATALAQPQTTAISFNCSGISGRSGDTATCPVTPFGTMNLVLSPTLTNESCPVATLAITFTFTNSSGSFSGKDPGSPYPCSGTSAAGTATITGGTGVFSGATGSVTYTGHNIGHDDGSFGGSGTITTGGSISGPGGSGYPAVACTSSDASLNLTIAGIGSNPAIAVPICDGPIAGPGGSGYPIALADVPPGLNDPLTYTGPGYPLATLTQKSSGPVTIYVGSPPILTSTTTYVAVTTCSNLPPSTLVVNTCWIVINTPNASYPANNAGVLPAVINPTNLAPGVYTANVTITANPTSSTAKTSGPEVSHAAAAADSINVPVALLIAPPGPAISLAPTGLRFQALAGSASQSQLVSVSNSGEGSLSFKATASTLSGGNWLSVSQTATQINIQANPAGLAAGNYFGRVDVAASGTANSPQSVEVVLTVSTAAAATPPAVAPSSLAFVTQAGSNPASQNVQLSNLSTQQLTISTVADSGSTPWFSATTANTTVASGQTLTATVAVNAAGLAPGVYNGTLEVKAAETNSDYPVAVVLIVTPASGTCTATQLAPVFTNLANTFQTVAGLPAAFEAQILDNCGMPLTSGSVMAYFPGGDPSVSLTSLGAGLWTGTWLPHNLAGGPATVGLIARSTSGVYGSAAVTGTLQANIGAPQVNPAGVVSAASLVSNAPISPGAYISIFGSNLAAAPASASSLPLPTTLGDTQVFLGGRALPLNYVGPGQINAVVPFEAAVNATGQLTVVRNGIPSLAETVMLAAAQPAVFTQDQSGKGAGVISVVESDGTQFANTPAAPAKAGDVLVIYCAGLGAVKPQIADGAAAPSSPAAKTVAPVEVTIGGKPAEVQFAGLVPGFAGLYQVNAAVPPGITPASDVPLILVVGNIASAPVTIAVK